MQQGNKGRSNGYNLESAQKIYIHTAQILVAPILLSIRLLLVRNNLYRDSAIFNLKREGKASYILYANHQSMLDPFIITASLPLRTTRQLLPFRFFVKNSYMKGIMGAFLTIMGGFPAHHDAKKPYGLDKARPLMSSNQTIVIFPQGMLTRKHIAKPGVSILSMEPNTYLIPAHIEWENRWHCHVHIGAPIKGGVVKTPEKLMEQVYALTKTIK